MRLTPCLAVLALAATSPSWGTPQEKSTEILEVIEAFPDDLRGPWQIGGRLYIADADTVFDLDHPAKVGRLVELEYVQRDGILVAVDIEPQRFGPADVSDGPHVFWRDATTAEVMACCAGEVRRETHTDIRAPRDVPSPCGNTTIHLDPTAPTPPPATWAMPSRLLAVSDIEGNYGALRRFLLNNNVIDAEGRWIWGDGHLLFNGDIVDRGLQVTETLWLIRQLEREAEAAGGRVHFVLGNHEAMIMAGDLRYVHLKYGFTCRRLGLSYDALHGPDTEIGRWFRAQNSVVRIGDLLFVHAGYSPALQALDLSLDEINSSIRSALGPPAWPKDGDFATRLAWDMQGPLWYRGYHQRHAADWGGFPTDAQINAILEHHDARHIVVGHTVVDDISWLDDAKRLLCIDVKWRDAEEAEGLLWQDDELWALSMFGERRRLTTPVATPTPVAP